ncbi:dihydrolipoamide acyltransferase [Cutibacterium acnes JCM 18918]|nr:dihydrolipoamide acyltransferase [Cutibacterium acnes JCM 18918]
MSRLRKVIASRMVESLQISAQLTATVEVDMTAISRIRNAEKAAFKAREGVGLSYLPFITKPSLKPQGQSDLQRKYRHRGGDDYLRFF